MRQRRRRRGKKWGKGVQGAVVGGGRVGVQEGRERVQNATVEEEKEVAWAGGGVI